MNKKRQDHDPERVRELVKSTYSALVTEERECCGGRSAANSCCTYAEEIGYTAEELGSLPEGVDALTYGCGNPLAFSDVQPGQTVLDLGSGAGLDLLIAAEKVGPTGWVIGVDMTEEMIEKARRNVAAAGHDQVEVRKGLIEDLPVESASVDWVISNCVINLSPEKRRVFAEIARVLKPGGSVLISDIVAEDLPQWVRESSAALCACIGGAISEEEYLAGLREAGLTEVTVRQRHVYSSAELAGLIGSPEALGGAACCTDGCCGDISWLSEELDGKVASISVFARKPAA